MAPALYFYLSMGLFVSVGIKIGIFLLILFTGPRLAALTKTVDGKEGSYERQQVEYVLSSSNEVAVFCNAGDTLIKGECDGRSESILPLAHPALNGFPDHDKFHGVYLESKEVTEGGRTGWACWSKVVRADEEMRITTVAKCKKSDNSNAQKTKTPRLDRGA